MHLIRTAAVDGEAGLSKHFTPHQIAWIQAERAIHEQHRQAVALAEKSVRIGWTYADAFKNPEAALVQGTRLPVRDQRLSQRAGIREAMLQVRRGV